MAYRVTVALTAASLALISRTAEAQCSPGAAFCAEVRIGGGYYPPAPPAPPPPQVIYVQPAPPPPVMVYQPAPPVVVYQPAPAPQQVVVVARPPAPPRPRRQLGLHGHIGGLMGDNVEMGGFTGALRYRPRPHLAFDFGIGGYAGTDYNGFFRREVPLTVDGLYFFNPEDELQIYGLGGLGLSFAHLSEGGACPEDYCGEQHDYAYAGFEIGGGLEWRANHHLALNADVRAFVRRRADNGSGEAPEFAEVDDETGAPTGRTTDTSGGGLLTLGATFYF